MDISRNTSTGKPLLIQAEHLEREKTGGWWAEKRIKGGTRYLFLQGNFDGLGNRLLTEDSVETVTMFMSMEETTYILVGKFIFRHHHWQAQGKVPPLELCLAIETLRGLTP